MRKQTNRIFSILLTLVMLLGVLPVSAQAAAGSFFSAQPQDGTAVKENGYPIAWKTITQAPVYWMYLDPNSPQWVAGDVLKKNPATLPYNAAHCLPNGTAAYKLVAVANDTQYESDPFQVTWVDGYRVTVNGGSGSGRYLEGDSVTITANAPETGKTFKEWTSEADVTFADATASTTTFTMPPKNVVLTATYQRVKPDTSVERPLGSGTVGDPFKISTVGELYWFTGFTNNYVAVGEDFAVERNEACAILMNDITVNPELLTESYGLNANSSLLADWSPISYLEPYCGTFDGNGHTISGLYYNTEGYRYEYYGFIARMGENGAVKDLTLKDTYFYTKFTGNGTPYAAGIVAFAPEASNRIENCHFDGVVGTEAYSYGGVAGGITAVIGGKIQDCTAKGRVIGADSYSGDNGKAGGIAGQAYVTAMISDCTNYAEVTCGDSGTGVGYAGGIAGYLAGTVKDCCNRGVINGYNHVNYNYAGGIVGWARGTAEQRAVISRCFNVASFGGSGIVDYIYSSGTYYEGYVTVKNCYNTGSVTNGIVGTAKGVGISITYCHNVGITTKPIIDSIINADDIEMENCYYQAADDTDGMDGTTAKTTEEFASSLGFVTKMLNAGNNGNWKQGGDYPILNKMFTLTVNGGTGSGEYGEGTPVTITANVPDGYLFAGWDGLDGLSGEDGQPARDTVATKLLMPKRDVELTAKFVSTTPVRPAKGDGSEGNPFQITNVGELYWFAGFVNETITADDITVSIEKACAKVMNDITVNHDLLADDYTLNVSGEDTDLLAAWTPIAPANGYMGTFDGQGHTISGIYYNPGIDTAFYSTYYAGFFGCYIDDGGIVRNLTLKDTYIGAPREKSTYDAGGIAGMVASGGTVENCHFDGTVTADDTNGTYTIGGIAGRNQGVIRNCTTKGLVKGYTKGDIGGIAGKVARYTEDGGYVIGCVNEATVKNTRSDDVLIYTGGIAGELYNGNIRDCCNKGNVSAVNDPAGVVSYVYGDSSVIRCWNEGDVEGEDSAGIVSQLRATVKNCYNTGSVNGAGIVARPYSYCSITYCHNVGDADSIVSFIDSYATIENCYYLADSETDVLDGTMYKTAAEFADGTVLGLLNNGHWTQDVDDDYPVLGDPPVSISGKVTVTGTSATASVMVKELSGKAILIVAQYSGGQMKAAQTVSVTADGTFAPDNPFTHAEGCSYKAFLLDADTYAPLCAAAPLSE